MTILCANGTHVYRVGNLHCTCGAAANGYTPTSAMIFQGYNPFNPHTPARPTADVPLYVLKAAEAVRATHLSGDGKTAYDQRQYGLWYCDWDEKTKRFGSWFKIIEGELPGDAVAL